MAGISIKKRTGLPTKRKKKFDIQEINAYATAYGRPVGRKEYIMFAFAPGLLFAGAATIIFYYWWLTAICFALGTWYGLTNIMPNMVKRKYRLAAMAQRAKFIRVVAQIATNSEKSMLMVLSESLQRLDQNGELYDDMLQMISNIGTDVSEFNVGQQFYDKRQKYNDDPIFVQFLEQVETGIVNGNSNIDTLQEIEQYHTQLVANQNDFIKQKNLKFAGYRLVLMILVLLVILASVGLNFEDFVKGFSHTWVGWSFGGVFLAFHVQVFVSFMKKYWDDDVTSIGVK